MSAERNVSGEGASVSAEHRALDGRWKTRVGSKVVLGAGLGALGGAYVATMRRLSLPGTVLNMGANFAIFAGICGTMQELVRASTSSEDITWQNTFASAFVTGGFLSGINRGPRSAIPGAIGFGSLLALAHAAGDYCLAEDGGGAGDSPWLRYWPSSLVRIHTREEVEELERRRRKMLEDRIKGES